MTPAEEAGWKVGDRGVVEENAGTFDKGSIVEFAKDDGGECPLFKLVEGRSSTLTRMNGHGPENYAYCHLYRIVKYDTHNDPINSPPHYTQGGIECIDAIRAALTGEEFRGYCKGNALKYIWRERHKGGDESLGKALWYLREARGENER